MTLARHSDVNLTLGAYSHVVLGDQVDALEALPDLDAPPDAAVARRTGADDTVPMLRAAAHTQRAGGSHK